MAKRRVNKKHIAAGLVICSVSALAVFFTQDNSSSINMDRSEEIATHQAVSSDSKLSNAITQIESPLAYESKYGALPASLRGTTLPKLVHVDDQGHLRISNDLRYLFDYFLSAIAEEELETLLLRVEEYMEYYLQEPALSEAKEVFAQYVHLKSALYELEQEMGEHLSGVSLSELSRGDYIGLLKTQLDRRNELRSTILSQEVHNEFYAEEEQYDQFTFDRMSILANESLSDEDKREQISQLEAQLPEDVQASMQKTQITEHLKTRTEEILANGGSQDDVRSLRREMFGEESVARFDQLDQERAEWQARIDTYLGQRQSLLNASGITEEEKLQQIADLRAEQFDELEQIRVKVYERRADAS